jgi:hypothetical protein
LIEKACRPAAKAVGHEIRSKRLAVAARAKYLPDLNLGTGRHELEKAKIVTCGAVGVEPPPEP